MATSGAYTFTVTRDDLIKSALQKIGKLGESDVITPSMTADCTRELNQLVKQWMSTNDFAPGLKTWTRRVGHLFLNASTNQYSLGPTSIGWANNYVQSQTTTTYAAGTTVIQASSVTGMTAGDRFGISLDNNVLDWHIIQSINVGTNTVTLTTGLASQASYGSYVFDYTTAAQQPEIIEAAVLRDSQLQDTPINFMTLQEYAFLPSKASPIYASDPTAIYYEFQLGNSLLYIDCGAAQDTTKHLVLFYMEPIQDILNATDNPEYPQEWYLALSWGLSKQICSMYHAVWTIDMKENYESALAIAQKKSPERSALYFQPGNDS